MAHRGERDRPDFSNVRSGASSRPAASMPTGGRETRRHTVKEGETLSGIAQEYYGDASNWRIIYEANRNTISDPDLIHPGQQLHIPNELRGTE